MLLVDAMEGAVGRELSWDEVFGCSAEEQLHNPNKGLFVQSISKDFRLLTQGYIP